MTLSPIRALKPSNVNRTSLFGNSDDDEKMESPPRSTKKQMPSARLFFGGVEEDDLEVKGKTPKRNLNAPRFRSYNSNGDDSFLSDISNDDISTSVLRPMDLNSTAMGTPCSHQKRKRPPSNSLFGPHPEVEDSDDDIFMSPRTSTVDEDDSPSYRTIDGRKVTSKNPFSPYTPNMTSDASGSGLSSGVNNAPSFPITFESRPSFDSHDSSKITTSSLTTKDERGSNNMNNNIDQSAPTKTTPPRLSKINLQRRDTNQVQNKWHPMSTNTNEESTYGYPDRHGQYAFTGSPIEEIDILENDVSNKVRRLRLYEDASTTSHHGQLFVDTEQANNENQKYIIRDEISPTDVMSFPAPPTPTKASSKTRYTPVRKTAVPETPMLERKGATRRTKFDDTDDDSSLGRRAAIKSRFNGDFDIIGQLGDGSFGTVYKCLSRLDGCLYAIKVAKRKAKGALDRDRMLKEVYALASLSDQADTAAFHIVRYHQAWMEDHRLYIQTELCSSNLEAEISRGMLSEQRRYKLLREMLLALDFIHGHGMVHLDIKPENIFIKNDQFKLGDFGLVSKISNHDVEEGDSRYMSKELLSGDHDDLTKSDIFSLGVAMYEICLGRPLPTHGEEWQSIRSGVFSQLTDTPYDMEYIIREMMDPDPNSRPKASELLKRRQLLSEEQKLLMREKSKVMEAKLELAQQAQIMKEMPLPSRKPLQRANTWNGAF